MNPDNNNQRILIAYYSHSGNTRIAAEQIKQAVAGDLFEIKPANAYPKSYNACTTQAKKECANGFKPELTELIKDINSYDVIFIGTPNWWSTMAPPVLSFLSSHDLSGKTVIPFVTHGGGGMARCETDIQKASPNAAFGKAASFAGGTIKNPDAALAKWAQTAALNNK